MGGWEPTSGPPNFKSLVLMIQDAVSPGSWELLKAEDGLEIVLTLLRFVHVGRQVAVQEAEHVPEGCQSHTHSTFIALERPDAGGSGAG